jgi:ketol-acid reductoisomerase
MRGHQEQVVVFGYGSQGSAQAQNLRDSGKNVRVFLRPTSPHIQEVKEAGIPVTTDAGKAAKQASIAAVLIPDGEQPKLYKQVLEPNLKPGAAIVFAHGFAIHYRRIVPRPDLDVLLVAPLGQGDTVRSDFVKGGGVPCIVAVAQDATGRALVRGHEYAKAISKTGPFIDTTFAEEVETDLFAEQAVLCGGVPELIRAAFETLVGAGYTPDVAYFSCLRELRAITKLLDRHSIAGMRKHISDTARFGAVTRGPRIIDDRTRRVLTGVLEEIRSGAFTQELDEERKKGFPNVRSRIETERRHQLEKIHRRHSPNNR